MVRETSWSRVSTVPFQPECATAKSTGSHKNHRQYTWANANITGVRLERYTMRSHQLRLAYSVQKASTVLEVRQTNVASMQIDENKRVAKELHPKSLYTYEGEGFVE